MKFLSMPIEKAGDVFTLCISKIRVMKTQPDLKLRMQQSLVEIVSDEAKYLGYAASGDYYSMSRSNTVGKVTKEEMLAVYNGRMAKKKSPGRDFYDKLIESAPYDLCPYCEQSTVKTVDHYLPESEYPSLAVTPSNLVPSCIECNTIKRSDYPSDRKSQVMHPYFDSPVLDGFLSAKIVFIPKLAVVFSIIPENGLASEMFYRLTTHFNVFDLAKSYMVEAARDVVGIKEYLGDLHLKGGMKNVRANLLEQEASWRACKLKSWKTALYKELSSSEWFCDGGFRAF